MNETLFRHDDELEQTSRALDDANREPPSSRRDFIWLNAMRALALEGSTTEERLERRARAIRDKESQEWTVLEPPGELSHGDAQG